MKNLTTGCGNWMEGWGFGDCNKIGKLTMLSDVDFIWKGHSQGRHGQKWNSGATVEFSLIGGKIEVKNSKGGYPPVKNLLEAVEVLKRMKIEEIKKEQRKIQRQNKKFNQVITLSLF
jgi:hypothetical protein